MSTASVVLGCVEETRDTLLHLARLGERPDHIVSISRDEALRQGVTNYVDLEPVAREMGVPFTLVRGYSMKAEEDVALFASLRPRVLLVVGWQRLVPSAVLEHVELGTIGFHGSANMLPWGRGRSPINWSIIEGRDRFALHMFFINPGVDDGDIIGIQLYDINAWDTCRSVYYKTAIAQAELLARYLPLIRAGTCPRLRQHGEVFHYPKRTPADGRIDWTADAESICRLVRAVTWPYPGAFTFREGETVSVWGAQPFSRDFFAGAEPGEVCFAAENGTGEFVVRCGDGTVLVTKAEAQAPLRAGDRLG
jgi:methionyl-tRNA formyltransferase